MLGYNPTKKIPELVENIKTSSNQYIKVNQFSPYHFEWQKGYGAFSYSRSQISAVAQYIENQEIHHQKITFQSEYLQLLRNFEVDFDERYVFDFFDDLKAD